MNRIYVLVMIVVVSGLIYFITGSLIKQKNNNNQITEEATATSRKIEDINWDEKVDQSDIDIIQTQIGCKKSGACWNKTIGKTVTGDNPIYAFDLDLNKDEIIDQKDIDLIKL